MLYTVSTLFIHSISLLTCVLPCLSAQFAEGQLCLGTVLGRSESLRKIEVKYVNRERIKDCVSSEITLLPLTQTESTV